MSDYIIGQMWTKNEGDILEETITDAIKYVDSLFIADGHSIDKSWDIIQSLKNRYPDKIEHIQQEDESKDRAQRTSLLNKIRARYKPENSWIQVFESDIFILDTNIRELVKNTDKLGLSWQTLNAVRKPGTWKEVDTYPNWVKSIKEIMPYAHWMEVMLYTFRPLPDLFYDKHNWRPWPGGFSRYTSDPVKVNNKNFNSPLLLHVGYRGPTHFYEKYKHMGVCHKRYSKWRLKHPQAVESTVSFFNGEWSSNSFPANREGWIAWLKSRGCIES